MINQFFATCINYSTKYSRIAVFLKLCGVFKDQSNDHIQQSTYVGQLRKMFYQTPDACSIYLRLVFLLHFSAVEVMDSYKPMIANNIYDNSEVYPVDVALEAAKIILAEENFDANTYYDFYQQFQFALQEDIAERTQEKQQQEIEEQNQQNQQQTKMNSKLQKLSNLKNVEKGIRVDTLADCVIEFLLEQKTRNLKQIITQLKITQSSRKSMDFNQIEFTKLFQSIYPNQSSNWIKKIFTEFIVQNEFHELVNINQLLECIFPELMKIEFPKTSAKQFYIDFLGNNYFQGAQSSINSIFASTASAKVESQIDQEIMERLKKKEDLEIQVQN
eukprot:TRINITY_DN4292_c0_g1_i1.p1 TRINITY_DN4292_c0_g1~~TRINITY_DN4292_c0_g1_i1.p1  ORF type:complete len:331 (-),score=43.01 TRINITY_DN4292_c0_g1_i1:418-1410(-)